MVYSKINEKSPNTIIRFDIKGPFWLLLLLPCPTALPEGSPVPKDTDRIFFESRLQG